MKTKSHLKVPVSAPNGAGGPPNDTLDGEVMTLGETATYLRLDEDEVVRMIREQGLPARLAGTERRILKAAVQQWLSQAPTPKGIWTAAGSWKDDPYLDEMVQEIYRARGRSMTEEG